MRILSLVILLYSLILNPLFTQEKEYQSVDPLLSNYRVGKNDGYSWRTREIKYSISDIKLSKDKLISTIWREGFFGILVFYTDDRFAYGGAPWGIMTAGSYRIVSHNQVELVHDDLSNEDHKGLLSRKKVVLNFVIDKPTLNYSHYLIIDKEIYYAYGSQPADGEMVNYQDLKIIKETKDLIASDNVNIRNYPDISASKIDLSSFDTSPQLVKGYLLTKGTIVRQVGYYDKEYTINNDSGKWLLIEIKINEDMYESSTYGWVFSPYFYNKN